MKTVIGLIVVNKYLTLNDTQGKWIKNERNILYRKNTIARRLLIQSNCKPDAASPRRGHNANAQFFIMLLTEYLFEPLCTGLVNFYRKFLHSHCYPLYLF